MAQAIATPLEAFAEAVARALHDPEFSRRIRSADTSAELIVTDGDRSDALCLLLDRDPPQVVYRCTGSCDARLRVDHEAFDAFIAGEASLAMAIVQGQADFVGPIRRVLRVMPVLARVVGGSR